MRVDRDAHGVLAAIPGVGAVQARPDPGSRLCYALDADEDLAPAVAAAIQRAGLQLYSLQTERRDLDAVFAEANAVAAAEAGEAEAIDA